MLKEIDVLKLVCFRLEKANIDYMLTGSLAANFYAVPRMTRDIDIVVEIARFHVPKFVEMFQGDFYIQKEAIIDALEKQYLFNIIHNESILKIDFVVRKDSPYRQVEFQRRRQIQLEESKIWIVSPEDLIISKLDWAKESLSDFQLRDVKNLLASVKNLDQKYLSKWIGQLGLTPVYERMLTRG